MAIGLRWSPPAGGGGVRTTQMPVWARCEHSDGWPPPKPPPPSVKIPPFSEKHLATAKKKNFKRPFWSPAPPIPAWERAGGKGSISTCIVELACARALSFWNPSEPNLFGGKSTTKIKQHTRWSASPHWQIRIAPILLFKVLQIPENLVCNMLDRLKYCISKKKLAKYFGIQWCKSFFFPSTGAEHGIIQATPGRVKERNRKTEGVITLKLRKVNVSNTICPWGRCTDLATIHLETLHHSEKTRFSSIRIWKGKVKPKIRHQNKWNKSYRKKGSQILFHTDSQP